MLFNSAVFGLFLALLLPLYAATRTLGARKLVLLVASYLFYAHWDWRYVGLLWLSTLVDYLIGRRLAADLGDARRRLLVLGSLVTNLGVLAVFKYGNFLLESVDALLPVLELGGLRLADEIPVGISFYTFQTLSYTIDVYRRRQAPCDSPLDFALFVALFPQLVAGPIVRSTELLPQLGGLGPLRLERVADGTQRFLLGLFKKVVLADNAALFVDAVFSAPGEYGALTLWCATWAFALQIYCDFSGYTDMALGLGRAFGLKLPENFDAPYLASSITDFWRRWHMSLSSWLRDYLYIPLGGSRGSRARTYANLMLTMLLGGLWHGAAWTFVVWGGVHGALLALERLRRGSAAAQPTASGVGRVVRWCVTLQLVALAWIPFRAESFAALGTHVARMFSVFERDDASAQGLRWAALLGLLLLLQLAARRLDLRALWERVPAPAQGLGLAALVLVVGALHVDDVAFIYFQF